jgi:uncharacterized protein YcbK (DUF882 family)
VGPYNISVHLLLALLALPVNLPGAAVGSPPEGIDDGIFDAVVARGEHLSPGEPRVLSKKEDWLRDKVLRPDFHTSDADLAKQAAFAARKTIRKTRGPAAFVSTFLPGERMEPVTTLYNVWTREVLPILPTAPTASQPDDRFHRFLRDHYTNQATQMDTRLMDVLSRVAGRFAAKRIEVVSGYRSPKYNLMLRKKGHQVARHSQHMEGTAVDFRIRGVATRTILNYVRSLRLGGVGFYPHSQFVHSDTGRVRYWTGS